MLQIDLCIWYNFYVERNEVDMTNLPKEFLSRMKVMLKDGFDEFEASFDKERLYGLRINTLKCDAGVVFERFSLQPIPWCDTGYYYDGESSPGKDVLHDAGAYYIQEPSAMAVVESMNVKEGDTVLDLCAAPGGKSTQIACKLAGKGLLVSNELIPSRAKILSQNIERMGIGNCIVLNERPDVLAGRFAKAFDKILVDAPCSGEGMFRKNALAVDEWSQKAVINCKARQIEILDHAADMLKDGGTLTYSTCTFSKEENEEVIDSFLSRHDRFRVVSSAYKFDSGISIDGGSRNGEITLCNRIYPHKVDGEGHFFAVLQSDGEKLPSDYSEQIPSIDAKTLKEWNIWQKENLCIEIKADLSFGQNLYAMPQGTPRLNGLKVLRAGLHLGEIKKNRFEPSHSLALALGVGQVKRVLDLDSKAAEKFISGQTVEYGGEKGWTLVACNGISLGWCKCDGVYAKNHYPKGLRK